MLQEGNRRAAGEDAGPKFTVTWKHSWARRLQAPIHPHIHSPLMLEPPSLPPMKASGNLEQWLE